MLSYRHSFHAGNHADVIKHIVLMLILENLTIKEKGFYYLDTHAGVGRYRLASAEAEKPVNIRKVSVAYGNVMIYRQSLHVMSN